MNSRNRALLLFFLYLVSLGILIAYAIVSEKYSEFKGLGWLTAIAVITTDSLILLLMKS